MMRLSKPSLALMMATTLLFGACGDGALELGQDETIREAASPVPEHHSQLIYLNTSDDVREAFQGGVAEFTPQQGFVGVVMMMTVEGDPFIEYQLRDANGDWSVWETLTISYHDGRYQSAEISAFEGATALRLRSEEDFQFVRLEFLDSLHAEDGAHFHDEHPYAEDLEQISLTDEELIRQGIARAGRWALPAATKRRGQSFSVRYDGAPSYNGGRNCSGSFTAGARELGEYLVQTFPGARYYQGYNCRTIAGSSSMSIHGTGRAIDVFIPLHGGQADNDLGDPVANWLVENADKIGVQLVIWDRTVWTGNRSGTKDRQYTGVHAHHDHLHIELNQAGASRTTQWFRNRGSASTPGTSPPPASGNAGSCSSQTLGRRVNNGECVQTSYNTCGGTCKWSKCVNGSWQCSTTSACGTKHGNAACGAAPAPAPTPSGASCYSSTLKKNIPRGECVQMPYNSCGGTGTCKWAVCGNSGWACTAFNNCKAKTHPSSACASGRNSCYSRTLGRNTPEGSRVQMSYNSCGGTCRWAECQGGSWVCQGASVDNLSTNYKHASCR